MHIQPPKKKNKHKHKQSRTQDPVPPGKSCRSCPLCPQRRGLPRSPGTPASPETPSDSDHKKKKKKKEEDPERKRKKKEKKKKKVGGESRAPSPRLCPPRGPPGSRDWSQRGAVPRGSHRIRVSPSSAEPAQPGAPRGGQLPGQQQQQLAVRPRRHRPGDPPAEGNGPG